VDTAIATLGSRMPPHRSYEDRLADLEREQQKLKSQVKPIVDLYSAGTLIGKLLWVIGGILTGAAVIWAAISGWITSHWK
jgi:hypothetical protein